jgi:hypothetical protein
MFCILNCLLIFLFKKKRKEKKRKKLGIHIVTVDLINHVCERERERNLRRNF